MSHVRTNFDSLLESNVRKYSADEVAVMTTKQFDELPLCDQISIYNRFPDQYNRLTSTTAGDTAPGKRDGRSDAERFADEFEQRVDDAISRVFRPNRA